LETFIFIWRTNGSFFNQNYPNLEIGEGNSPAAALAANGYGGGAINALDFYDTYGKGRLTGCVVEDLNPPKGSPQFKTVVPDFYRENDEFHQINHSFEFVFEATILNNPERFNLGYNEGGILNPSFNNTKTVVTKTVVTEMEDGLNLSNLPELFGKSLSDFPMGEFSPKVQFEVANGTFEYGAEYRIVCGKQTNNFIELVKV
jgi:hypothetical protein